MSTLSILVVDREATAEALAAALRRQGHRVRTAPRTGALEALLEELDALVLAIGGPGDPSLGTLRALRARGCALRVLAVVPCGDSASCRAAFLAGADDVLERPLRSHELASALAGARRAGATRPDFVEPPETLELELVSCPDSLESCARAAASFALAHGLGPATRARIASALAECVENAMLHAYPLEPGLVRVRLSIRGEEAVAEVSDEGLGFDAAEVALDGFESPLHNGLARLACLCEEVDLDARPGKGTRVRLRFSLYRIALGEAGDLDLSERDHLAPEDARDVLHQVQALGRGDELILSPALAVVVGRLLAGPDLRRRVELALKG